MTRDEVIDLIARLDLKATETALLLARLCSQQAEIERHNAQEPLGTAGGLGISLGVIYRTLADMHEAPAPVCPKCARTLSCPCQAATPPTPSAAQNPAPPSTA